jgi:hypothetical protein
MTATAAYPTPHQRHRFTCEIGGRTDGEAAAVEALRRGRHLLQRRVGERRVCAGNPPLPPDSRRAMAWDSIATLFAPGPEPPAFRLVISALCLTTLFAPTPIATWLVRLRFS